MSDYLCVKLPVRALSQMGKSVALVAKTLEVIAGYDPLDPATNDMPDNLDYDGHGNDSEYAASIVYETPIELATPMAVTSIPFFTKDDEITITYQIRYFREFVLKIDRTNFKR